MMRFLEIPVRRFVRCASSALLLGLGFAARDAAAQPQYLGRLGGSPCANSTANRFGAQGSPFRAQSPNNPYTTQSPVLISV